MDNIFTVVNSTIIGIIGLLTILLKYILGKKVDNPIVVQNNIDDNVMAALEYIKKELKADRVCVHEFHNGGKYLSGNSQQKISISYESLSSGTSSIFRKFQNVRTSALCTILKKVIKDKVYLSKLSEQEAFPTDLKAHGSTVVKFALLNTLTNKPLGILSIHYVKCNRITLTEKEKQFLDKQRKIITGYLISHKISI